MNHDDRNEDFDAFVEWELNKRRGRSATYTQPLLPNEGSSKQYPLSIEEEENIHSFLSEFYHYQIFDNMMNMKHILQQYNDTVAIHYSLLVPTVCSFDEFWSRYYYRCSIIQVKKDLMTRQQRTGSYYTDDTTSDHSQNTTDHHPIVEQSTPIVASGSLPTTGKESREERINSSLNLTNNNHNNTTRTQMFYQEQDRDIIEVIQEDENDEIDELTNVSINDDK